MDFWNDREDHEEVHMENLRLPEMQHLHIKQINLLNNFISEFKTIENVESILNAGEWKKFAAFE